MVCVGLVSALRPRQSRQASGASFRSGGRPQSYSMPKPGSRSAPANATHPAVGRENRRLRPRRGRRQRASGEICDCSGFGGGHRSVEIVVDAASGDFDHRRAGSQDGTRTRSISRINLTRLHCTRTLGEIRWRYPIASSFRLGRSCRARNELAVCS